MKKRKEKSGKIGEMLNKSPINYFSDLFIVAMVLGWIIVLLVMIGFAAYATINYADVSICRMLRIWLRSRFRRVVQFG